MGIYHLEPNGGRVLVSLGVGIACCAISASLIAMAFGWLPGASGTADPPAGPPPVPAADVESRIVGESLYGRHVRPVLSDRCYTCHGPDAGSRQADLRLDREAAAHADRGGYHAIKPGDAPASELWKRITSDDPAVQMPPPDANQRPLSREEKQAIRQWIDRGAKFEPHWSFVPPTRPIVPEVATSISPRGPIDHFVFARLAAARIEPSPAADRATLLRRVFLDLTGLPPTAEEQTAFLADERDDAYERLVDRLLETEPYRSRFAEHFTSTWLDAARYADTCGIHTDNGRQMWLWRDWVLDAYRTNMPYDRFVTEQLAGDLLPDATASQRIASGFNRNHVTTDEGGAIPAEYLVEYAVDRASTTASVFLGLTMNCARCHDHKFDPIPQADFFRLYAFFNSVDEPGLYSQTKDANRAYEPYLEVPNDADRASIEALEQQIRRSKEVLAVPIVDEATKREAFERDARTRTGVRWSTPGVIAAASTSPKVKLTPGDDGVIVAAGDMPNVENYTIELRGPASPARLLLLEAMATPGAGPGAGRASHGNAVISGMTLHTKSRGPGSRWARVPLSWAWSDHTQMNNDFVAGNVLHLDDLGWAADGNKNAGSRLLVVSTPRRFGGERLRVTLSFRSKYPQHSLGRIRFRVGHLHAKSLAAFPPARGRWYSVGPFTAKTPGDALDHDFGPETLARIDPKHNFGAGNQYWRFAPDIPAGAAGRRDATQPARDVHYAGRMLWSPDRRTVEVRLAVGAPYRVFLNAKRVAIERGADSDRATLALRPGQNALVLKIAGSRASFSSKIVEPADELTGSLVTALIPRDARSKEQDRKLAESWRRKAIPAIREAEDARADAEAKLARIRAGVPRTMVMRELPEPRQAYVLTRGEYDHPDKTRPVAREVPSALGALPAGAPRDRRGLAQWIVSAENPLTARVAVNRVWQILFGRGIVRTPEDFGLQGEWPTHPKLLDWLAVTFRESGWDRRALIRSIVVSHTYRQSSAIRATVAHRDPDNRLLSYYPRRRLTAEQIRDQALYVAGLLAERRGGPSVKPYQPAGLWREVAMTASNTRMFERGAANDLWRRSLYTYWKRACPPPTLQTFDAPTRESCVVYRPTTNTPLQALALWNDVQFIEAARVLAQRTVAERGEDGARIVRMFRRATGRVPLPPEATQLMDTLTRFRARYRAAPDDATALVQIGTSPLPANVAPAELAAWALLASAILSLHETVTQD